MQQVFYRPDALHVAQKQPQSNDIATELDFLKLQTINNSGSNTTNYTLNDQQGSLQEKTYMKQGYHVYRT